jgi:competence protein ComEC
MSAASRSVLRVKILDVGEGDAIVLLLPDCSRAIVVDAFDGDRVVEALEAEGVDEVILFLSHSDYDHIAGVVRLLDNFRGAFVAFFYNKDRINAGARSEYRKTLQALGAATRNAPNPFSDEFNVGLNSDTRFAPLAQPPVTLEVIHPTHDEQSSLHGTSTNEPAGVLRVEYTNADGNSWAIILAADVQLTGISCMMHRFSSNPGKLSADVLKFPHHGAWPTEHPGISQFPGRAERSMLEFLDAVNPQYVILSVGHDNSHGHVRSEVFAALTDLASRKKRLRRILCTQFTRTCLGQGATCTPSHCAGDIEIRIGEGADGGIEVLPEGTTHRARILNVTDHRHAGCGSLLS